MSKDTMKIVSLQTENVKRLKAVRIKPDGNLVVIGGKNGNGKTSVLDSIMMALGGKDAAPEMPVRRGQDKAEIVLDLGDLIVRRYFTASDTTGLEVKTKDGNKFASPQKMLDELTGRLSFDPIAFSRKNPKEQVEILRGLLQLDFTQLDAQRKTYYDERTAQNRITLQLEQTFKGMPEYPDAPQTEVSIAALNSELQRRNLNNAEGERLSSLDATAKERYEVALARIDDQKANIEYLKRQIQEAEQKLAEMNGKMVQIAAEAKEAAEALASFVPEDTAQLIGQIENAEQINNQVRSQAARVEARKKWQEAHEASEALTKKIEEIDAAKAKMLAEAQFPVPGLAFDDDGVLYNGIPFTQCSAAEQLRVSTAMAIAMNPRLRVMLIRDGSLLDEDSLALIHQMAEEHDCQIWLERVGLGDDCSVIIEDGEVLGEQPKLEAVSA